MAGQYSPFGIIGQLKEKFGYTHDYILWGQAWVIFLLEIADAPRYVRGTPPSEVVSSASDALKGLVNYE